MTNKEAVETLREEFCKLKLFCELYPDACQKENCDIYLAIEVLKGKDTVSPSIDTISRQAAIDALYDWSDHSITDAEAWHLRQVAGDIKSMPPVQPKQRYTEEELMVFRHGISLSLLSKRSSQHWSYDEDTAKEIEFLKRLYEKVDADMRGGQDEVD